MMRRPMMRPAMLTCWKLPFSGSKSGYFRSRGRDGIFCGGIGLDTELPQCRQRIAAQLFLFAEFVI